MHKVLVYCETWCVQFRFLSLTIPKSYNSMMLESCSYYFFAHRLSFCCQCKHSPRAGLEASRTPIMIADIQMAGLTISSSPVHTNVMVKLIDTRIYTVLMSVFATQLRSKEATVRWKDRDRSEDPLEQSVYMHRKYASSVCISYFSWGSDKTPDNSSLRLTEWAFPGHLWQGSHGSRSTEQLVTLHLRVKMQREMNAQLAFPPQLMPWCCPHSL